MEGDLLQKFWRWLGLNLGKHWVVVLVVGGLTTIVLGYGATNLQFSTGQDSYLNKSDQVYKDSVAYQKLFGGEAMVVLVTMNRGHTVNELFTPKNIAQWTRVENQLHQQRQDRERRDPAHRSPVQQRARVEPDRRSNAEHRGQDPSQRDGT